MTRAEHDRSPQFYPWFTSFQDAAFGPTGLADSLYLSLLAVTPTSQRKGLGRSLVEAALEEADRLGVASTLVTQEPDKVGRSCGHQQAQLLAPGEGAPSVFRFEVLMRRADTVVPITGFQGREARRTGGEGRHCSLVGNEAGIDGRDTVSWSPAMYTMPSAEDERRSSW